MRRYALLIGLTLGHGPLAFSSGVVLEPIDKLTLTDDSGTHLLGSYLALDGGVAYAGAPLYSRFGSRQGAGFLYDAATGEPLGRLRAPGARGDDRFGAGDLDGDFVVIGANGDSTRGQSAGAAFLFNTAAEGSPIKITASDAAPRDSFGDAVAIDDGKALVGAYNTREGGAAYLFDASTGEELIKLIPDDLAPGARFGGAVALDTGVALVGAVGTDPSGAEAGVAYLFDAETGLQTHRLAPPDGIAGDFFGRSVALDGDVALVGSWGDDPEGSAYLFDVPSGELLRKLTPEDPTTPGNFGWSVAVSDGIALVGALGDFVNRSTIGAAYLFDVATGAQLQKITPPDGVAEDDFGRTVALGDGFAMIASRSNEPGQGVGSVYLYRVIPEPSSLTLVAVACWAWPRHGRGGLAPRIN